MKEARENQRDVLLVDGDAARRRQTGEALQSVYHVTAALDGEMAVELLHGRQDFAAVVVQCRLYDFSGFDLIRYLHTNRALSAIPIVAIGEPEDEMKALSLGAAGFVRSPGDPRLICCQVQNLVNLIWSDRERDVLTGALLLDPFLKQAQQKLEESAKGGRSPRWAVAFLNVSRFKTFNDLFGRAAGDQLLRNLAARLMQGRGVEFVGRTGADRFFVLCRRDELDLNAVEQLGGELMRRLHLKYGLRVCCGVYEVEDASLPIREICDRAQLAEKKASGRSDHSVAFYDEQLRRDLRWEQSVSAQMYDALESGQFQVYLQPIFSLSSNRPVSAEALVRWVHPEHGMIPPDRFIPIFERNGFISKLDEYVWDKVFRYLAEFKAAGYPDLTISSNMSRLDTYSMDVCAVLTEMAKKYGVRRSAFRVEVTESAYMDDPRQLLEVTGRLSIAGFPVMIDDFGSGYSSLNMLMDMPVSTLKLDMSFIRGLGTDERTNCVVSSILRMARWLEIGVVAEGVETQTHVDYLRAIGCDRVQGYYFSRPVPKDEFVKLLEHYQKAPVREKSRTYDRTADMQSIWSAVTVYDRMLRGRMDAAVLYEQRGGTVELLCVNDSYYKMMESTPTLFSRNGRLATAWLVEKDRAIFLRALDTAARTAERQELVLCRYMDAGRVKKLMVSICYMGRKDDRRLFLGLIRDISKLPISSGDLPPAQAELPAGPAHPADGEKREQVLIVEDNTVNRMILRKMLSEHYDVLEAPNGKAGLEALRREPGIRAVLLDIIMPIMDGYEFLREKERDPALKSVPVLVLSQSEGEDSREKALSMWADGFVHKPYDKDSLSRLLDSIVSEGEQERKEIRD